MASDNLWNLAPALIGAPLAAIAATLIVTVVRAWPAIMAKVNEARRDRANIRTSELERMDARMQRLEDRCEALEAAVRECEKREAEWRRRAVTAEAALQGQGEVRQAGAVAAAEARIDEAVKAQGKKP